MPGRWKKQESHLRAPFPGGAGKLLAFVIFSWVAHTLSLYLLSRPAGRGSRVEGDPDSAPVRINFVNHKSGGRPRAKKPRPKKEVDDIRRKKIVELVQKETKKAPDPNKARLGRVTHRSEKEIRSDRTAPDKAGNSGRSPESRTGKKKPLIARAPESGGSGGENSSGPKDDQPPVAQAFRHRNHPKGQASPSTMLSGDSPVGVSVLPRGQEARSAYKKLLENSIAMLGNEVMRGYQGYVEDDLEMGETLDLNTQEYRYLGYFTSLRKAIELAWVYPSGAIRKRLYGNVFLKFTIHQDGGVSKIMVLDSSGHRILDLAIMEAVRLASPFAPLPQAFGKKINIQGTFRYLLN